MAVTWGDKAFAQVLFLIILSIICLQAQSIHNQLDAELRMMRYLKTGNRRTAIQMENSAKAFRGDTAGLNFLETPLRYGKLMQVYSSQEEPWYTLLFLQNDLLQYNWEIIKTRASIVNVEPSSPAPLLSINHIVLQKNTTFDAMHTFIHAALHIEENNVQASFLGDVEIQRLEINNDRPFTKTELLAHGNLILQTIMVINSLLPIEINLISTSGNVKINPNLGLNVCSCDGSSTSPTAENGTFSPCLKLRNFDAQDCKIIVEPDLSKRSALLFAD